MKADGRGCRMSVVSRVLVLLTRRVPRAYELRVERLKRGEVVLGALASRSLQLFRVLIDSLLSEI
jgi:hypothetical protein